MIHHGRAENNRQSRISGLVAFLSGQTLVLLVILSAHFWIWTFYSPRTFPLNGSCSILCNTAMMFFDLCYALKTFCNNLPSTRMSVQYNWPVTSIVWYYLGKKKTKKKHFYNYLTSQKRRLFIIFLLFPMKVAGDHSHSGQERPQATGS